MSSISDWGSNRDRAELDAYIEKSDDTPDCLLDSDLRYEVSGYGGVAWRYIEDETKPDEDTEWSGIENPTGNVIMIMVGDDREFVFDPDDCTALDELDYCHECGQIGCGHDGLER